MGAKDEDAQSGAVNFQLYLQAKKVFKWVLLISLVLVGIYLLLTAIAVYTNHKQLLGMVDRFDLDQEDNIPTWWSTILLLIASAYAFIIARYKSRIKDHFTRQWTVMSGIFLYMSIDEGGSLHETANIWGERIFGGGINLGFVTIRDWTEVAMIAVILVTIYFFRFGISLPRKTFKYLVLSGVVYVTGAILVESLQYTSFHFDPNGYAWQISVAVEEGMEMIGVCIAIYALADYAQRYVGKLTTHFE